MIAYRAFRACLLAALCVLNVSAWSQQPPPRIPTSERRALLTLYASTQGASWTVRTNWLGAAGSECQWYGVVCNGGGDAVNVVSLPNNNLTGPLPDELNALTHLGIFDVSNNRLIGPIPALTGLAELGNFNVAGNQLTGSIPSLYGLAQLRNFIASDNRLTGAIPNLTGTPLISFFHVANNQLTGTIPALDGLTHLSGFNVGGNQLTGDVPSVPVPTGLQAGRSTLCPNYLNHTADAAWNAATGQSPWYANCPIAPQAGLWWNPAESGSGYGLDFRHGVLVVTVYSYTESGPPIWYLASGPVIDNVFTATLDKYQGGQCISCAYRPTAPNGNDGTISIFFTSPTKATMILPGGRNFPIVPQDF